MAFSWFDFGIRAYKFTAFRSTPILTRMFIQVLIALLLTLRLGSTLSMMNPRAWYDDTAILPGFGTTGGYGYGGYGYGQPMMYANGQMPYVIQQAPGHSVVIHPNPGGVPTVQQVPGVVPA